MAGAVCMLPLLPACTSRMEERPNIILFVTDDHGMDALGCYGNPIVHTPNLDRLAAEGVRFTNAYCTSASSAASRSVILTGLYGHATGAYGHVHDYHHFSTYEDVRSLPVILAENGYRTARIGKYHVAPEKVYHFDRTIQADPRNTVEMADACRPVFDSREPFFLYFCTDDPHRSDFTVAKEDWRSPNLFGNKPEGYAGVHEVVYSPDKVIVPDFLPDTPETRAEMAQYYQSVSRVDEGFGRLMQHLEASGKADNTIVIYISDNGVAFPGAKTTLYEPGIHLPCIVKDPRTNDQGKVNEAMISWVDLTPTILDYAGADLEKEHFHGRSFRSVIGEEHSQGWDRIGASHTFHEITMYYPMRVWREGRYKLIWNIAWPLEYPFASDLWVSSTWQSVYRNGKEHYGKRQTSRYLHRPEFELYDLESDPDEIVNLAEDARYADLLDTMKASLKRWQYETEDPWLIMWNHDTALQGAGERL